MEKETKKKVLSSKEKRKNVINCVIAVLVAVIFLFQIGRAPSELQSHA